MRRRRSVSVFGLSFLDVMFCGFGSVVLLVMIVNSTTVTERRETHRDLRAEVARLERESIAAERELEAARDGLEAAARAAAATEDRSASLAEALARADTERAALADEAAARRASVDALARELASMEAREQRLAQAAERPGSGDNVRRFLGEGDRQYLTGLRMGGERVLILVDASASMLDDTIVNVVRRRNLPQRERREAPKWRRAIATVQWLIANLPPDGRFQLYAFGTEARALIPASAGGWIEARDAARVEAAVAALDDVVPAGGTSLHAAFDAVAGLAPRPDNVMLVTDGLPTQGAIPPRAATVAPDERMRHFESALARLPAGVPVNAILFPMEGDPLAASAFWRLAMRTGGAFLAPSRDWP